MVRSILLTFTMLLLCAAGVSAQTVLTGTVKDAETGETLIGATVKILKGAQIVRGVVTDYEGQYRLQLDAGTYDVEISYTGYTTSKTTGVQVLTGKINDFNVEMSTGTVLTEAVIKEYKAPLFKKDQTSGGQTLTSENIKNLPTRSVNAIVATTAGTTSIDGGDVNIKGVRANGTNYYIDGIRVQGAVVPVQDIEQLDVVTSGLGAEYGDVTGGVISVVTKGPAPKFSGGVDIENSHGLDPYGWFLGTANISGPILKRKFDNGSEEAIIGFRLSGQYLTQKDEDPPAFAVARAKESVIDRLNAHPLTRLNGVVVPGGQALTQDSVDYYDYRPFENRRDIDLTGKLDFRLSKNIDISITGTYKDIQDKETQTGANGWSDNNWLLLNSQNNPTFYDSRWRGLFRFRHRLGGDNTSKDASSARRVSISNASYTLQFGFERANADRYDPRHKDRLFDYGYVGTFDFDYQPIIGPVIDSTGFRLQQIDTREVFMGYQPGYQSNGQTIIPNQGFVNYNEFVNPESYTTFVAQNGRFRDVYANIWSGMHRNINWIYNRFSKSENDIITINATSGFDLKLGNTGTHNIQFGLMNEQRTSREYVVSPWALWDLAYLKSNSHINGLDLTDTTGTIFVEGYGDAYTFGNDTTVLGDQKFYWKVRQANGVPIDEYINLHGLRPDQLNLSMFGALELTNQELLNYRGYDYTGNKLDKGVTFNDFFTSRDADGVRDFPVAALQPLYQAAYIKDKFQFKDMIFSLGLRVERFDLNTKTLKDPYSLYEIMDADEYFRTVPSAGERPASIEDDYKVYVKSQSDLAPKAYRKGDVWYSPDGTQQNDANLIFGTSPVVPLLRDTISGDNILDQRFDPNTSFKDYEPQVNWMPRLAFSFPISDNANFFAHYDVLVQRPPSNWEVTPLNYVYFYTNSRTPENNANLKPERVVDYEMGFKQKLNNFSAITFSAYYKELRDMLQLRTILYVPTIGRYDSFGNVDFGTVKGFTFVYDLRRIQNFEARLAYTLQFADGTGSNAESQRGLTRFGNIRTLYPLDFDERHNISSILDYRFASGKQYNGPRIAGKDVLANFGVNMQVTAASGRPYTAKDLAQRFGAKGTAGAINGSRLPWRATVDLRVDKSFNIAPKGSKSDLFLNVYFRVTNLLDRRNVVNVYGYTGSPTDDGYLATQEGQSVLKGAAAQQQAYLSSYSWALLDPNNFTQPRRMYIGASFAF